MVKANKKLNIPDRSPPGSTRTAQDVKAAGHHVSNGIQNQLTTTTSEETVRPQRKKWTNTENRLVIHCYYKSDPTQRGYRKRMHQLWKDENPTSDITEQRLSDQQRVIMKNSLLTKAELEEIQANVSDKNEVDKEETKEEEKQEPEEQEELIQTPYIPPNTILTEEEERLKNALLKYYHQPNFERQRLPSLKQTKSKELTMLVTAANHIIETIPTKTLSDTNKLIYAAAIVITEELGFDLTERKRTRKNEEPRWKRRLLNNIKKWRADISNLENLKNKTLKNRKLKLYLVRKYLESGREIKETIEILKQRVTATGKKIERYEARIKQYQQNKMFNNNQRRFYQQLQGEDTMTSILPDKNETTTFWRDIWSNPVKHNSSAAWIREVGTSSIEMEPMIITIEQLKKQVSKIKNWSAPGKDEVHGYWLKHLRSTHARLAHQMNKFLETGKGEDWLTTGRTILLMKDKAKGPIPSNYRPITCLPTTFKLLTAIIAHSIQTYLESNDLMPEEQKGNRRGTRGTKDQLLIDKMILRNSKTRKTNLQMAWIDYKKAFDSVPHSWIHECLKIYGVSRNIRDFLQAIMKKWNTELTVNGEILGQVKIKRGIFQGDSLSPLLFVMALIPLSTVLRKTGMGYQTSKSATKISHLLYMDDLKLYAKSDNELESLLNTVRIFSKDICMEFGLDKCAILTLKRGKVDHTEGITLPDNSTIKQVSTDEAYKYLGILQAEDIKHTEMKSRSMSEYKKRVRKILKSKLNAGNIIKAINTWAVPVLRYTGGIINWTREELDNLDRKTRKLMTANKALHPKSDVDRLYLSRKEGGRGLIQVRQTIEEEEKSLYEYINNSQEAALIQVREAGILKENQSKLEYREQTIQERRDKWHNKALHGQYIRDIDNKCEEKKTWAWLTLGELKKETESLIIAAQDQALRTNAIKARIDKTSDNSKCRLCKEKDETVDHLVSSCSKIAQTDYKERHDKVAKMLHWNLCKKYNLPAAEQWWKHVPEKVVEDHENKILWDFKIQTDRKLAHNIPDITVVEKKQVWLIDVAIPGDARIEDKTLEKITKYQDLRIEVQRLMERKAKVVPIIIGALGAIPKDLEEHLNTLELDRITISQLQKAALLGTAHILRRYLN